MTDAYLERLHTVAENGYEGFVLATARVNLCEADLFVNHCVVVSSLGSLIQATVGSAGGVGGLRTNRSGRSA